MGAVARRLGTARLHPGVRPRSHSARAGISPDALGRRALGVSSGCALRVARRQLRRRARVPCRSLRRPAIRRSLCRPPSHDSPPSTEPWRPRARGSCFCLRLSPLVPYVLLNYVLGISRVRFRDYMLGSPGCCRLWRSMCMPGRSLAISQRSRPARSAPRGATYYWLLALGLASTALATVLVTRAAARAVESRELVSAAVETTSPPMAETGKH